MHPRNNFRVTPFIVGFVLIGVACLYFFTSIRHHASGIFGFILVTTFVFGIAYYVNELVVSRLISSKNKKDYVFVRQKSKHRVEALEQDIDHLSEIVRDLAHIVDKQIHAPVMLQPRDFTLYLRPCSDLSNHTIVFYEALNEPKAKREFTDEMRVQHLITKSEAALKRLHAKNPTIKIMLNVPFTLIENGSLARILRKRDYNNDFIINIEGIFNINFSLQLEEKMKELNELGVRFCLTECAPIMKLARNKAIFDLKLLGVDYLRGSFERLEEERAQKADFETLQTNYITFIADDLDDTINPQDIQNLNITHGQGPKIGIARPVKAEFLAPLEMRDTLEYRKTA